MTAKKKKATKVKGKAKRKPAAKVKGKAKPKAKSKGKADAKAKSKGKQPPTDPTPIDDKSNGPRVVATVVLCSQCGEPNQVPVSTTATGINTKCARCENQIRISGAKLAKLRVARDSIRKADQIALLPTAPGPGGKGKGKGDGKQRSPDYQVLRFRCTAEQWPTIQTALEVARRMCNEEGKDWNARSLELICGDFLSGAPAEVVAQVQADKGTAKEAASNVS